MNILINLLKQYIDNNYIQYPTADIHVGYNRALGELKDWILVQEQESSVLDEIEDLKNFIDELHIKIDYSDYLQLIDMVYSIENKVENKDQLD